MSRTHHREHLSPGDRAKRGGRKPKEPRKNLKTPKQTRPNNKVALRKEHL